MPCGGGRLKVSDINDHVKCTLCEGYLVDATAIIECLHAFCRTCIVRYLENSNYCPVCDVQVHKTKPLLSIRSDQTLQDVVYKLVPGLYQNEMQRRREFYAENPEAGSAVLDPEECGEGEPRFFSPKEPVSLCLQLRTRELVKPAELSDFKDPITTRHLKCPAAFTVGHLKKFVHLKFSLPNTFTVEIFYDDHLLRDGFTLMDVAYIYSWKRAEPMRFFYTVTKRIPRCTEPPPQISTTVSLRAEESAGNSEPPQVSVAPEEPMEIDLPTPLSPVAFKDPRPVADPETPSSADPLIPNTHETVVTSSVEEAQPMDTTEQPPEMVVVTATRQEGQQCNSDVTPCHQSSIQNRTSSSPPVVVPAKPPQVPTTPYKVVSLSSPSGGALSSSSPTHNGFRLKFIHDKKKTAKSSSRKSSSGSGNKRQKEGTHKHHHKPVRLARLAPYPPPPPVTCLTTTSQAQVVPGQLKVTVGKLVPSVIKTFVTTLVSTTTSSSNSTTTTVSHSSVMDVVSGSPCPPATWLAPPFLNCGSQSVGNSIASASSTTATSSSSVSSPHTISSLPQTTYTTKELPSITTNALPVVALAAISSNSSMPLPNTIRNSAHIAMAPSEVSSSRTISSDTLSSNSHSVADNGTVVPSSRVSEQKRNSDSLSHVSEFCSSVTGVITTCPPPVISNNHPVPSASNCTMHQHTDIDSHVHNKQLVNKNSGSHVGGLMLPSSIAAAKNSNDVDGQECPNRSVSPRLINENSSKVMKSSTTSENGVDSSHCISSSPVNGILSDKSSTIDSPAVTHSDLSSVTDMNNKSASGVDLLNNSLSAREDSNGLSYDKIPSTMEGAHSNSSSQTKDVVHATSQAGVVVHSHLGVINSNDSQQQQQQTTLLSADYSDDDLGCQSDLVVDEQKMEDRSSDEDEESEDLRKKISAIANNDDEDTEADSGRASDMSCPARSPPVSSGVTESVVTTTTVSMTTTADRPMKVGSSIDHVIKQLYLQHEIGRVLSPRPTTTTTTSKDNASSGALDLSTGCDRARKPASGGRPRPVANPVLDLKHRQQSYMPAPIKQHTACPPAPAKQHAALPSTNTSPLLMQHLTGSGSILQAQLTGGKHPLLPHHHHHPSLHPLHAAAAALPYSLPMGRNSSLAVSSSSSLSSSSPLVTPTYSYKFSPAHQGTYSPVGSAMLPYGSSLLNRMPPGFAGMLQPARMLSANSSSPIGSGSKSPLPGCHATTTTKQHSSSRRLSEALVAASSSTTPASHPRASPSSLMRLSPLHRSASPAPSPQSMSVSSSSSNNNGSSALLSSSSSQCGGSNHHHKSSSSVHHHHRSSSKGPTNHRFRKGPNLAVFNPDPNGFRQKLVIKNLDSASRPSIRSSNSHHHHHS